MSADFKVCYTQKHLVDQTGDDNFHEVEEKEDDDSDNQCALPDEEFFLLSVLLTDHQKLQLTKVELLG